VDIDCPADSGSGSMGLILFANDAERVESKPAFPRR
jgi:hypothetical protein